MLTHADVWTEFHFQADGTVKVLWADGEWTTYSEDEFHLLEQILELA